MITNVCQRWREKRGVYRPADEVFRSADYEVVELSGDGADSTCKNFFGRHHYLGEDIPSAIARYQVVHVPTLLLVGIILFSYPTNVSGYRGILDLGRLALLDEVAPGRPVGANIESHVVSDALRRLRRDHGTETVFSFSDPVPRRLPNGELLFKGHIGTIYQSLSAWYSGRTRPDDLLLLPNGSTIHRRTIQKIRQRETGRGYAVRKILEAAAASGLTIPELPDDATEADARRWVDEWIPRATVPIRHSGNLRYVFNFCSSAKRAIHRAYPDGTDGNRGLGRNDYPKFHTLTERPRVRPARRSAA